LVRKHDHLTSAAKGRGTAERVHIRKKDGEGTSRILAKKESRAVGEEALFGKSREPRKRGGGNLVPPVRRKDVLRGEDGGTVFIEGEKEERRPLSYRGKAEREGRLALRRSGGEKGDVKSSFREGRLHFIWEGKSAVSTGRGEQKRSLPSAGKREGKQA